MNQLKQTAHIPAAGLTMDSATGQKRLSPMAITSLVFLTPTHGGPPQIETVTWQWGPDEMREFAEKLKVVADQLDNVVAPLGMPAPITRNEAFDLVAKIMTLEQQKAGASFEREAEIEQEIRPHLDTLALGGWNFDELSRDIGSDVKDKSDALERARKIVTLTCKLGRQEDPESEEATAIRKEIGLASMALQAAGFDVEKLTLGVALDGEGCRCGGGVPDDLVSIPHRTGERFRIGRLEFCLALLVTNPLGVQLADDPRQTALNLVETARRNGYEIEAWPNGDGLVFRIVKGPMDYTMRTVTHWRIKDGDGEELILSGGQDPAFHQQARQQLVGEDPDVIVEAVKTLPMKEMDFRQLREFQG